MEEPNWDRIKMEKNKDILKHQCLNIAVEILKGTDRFKQITTEHQRLEMIAYAKNLFEELMAQKYLEW